MIKTCNLCSGEVEYTDSSKVYWGKSYGMIYLCKRCGAFVGVHKGTNQPLGTLADGELRAMRKATHELFDFLWKKFKKDDSVRRGQHYKKLAELMDIDVEKCHIGMFGKEQCHQAIKIILNNFYQESIGK